jgi:hypothetical protein
MQGVRGSNPRSSTSQLRAINSNGSREAAFLFQAPAPSSGASAESANWQVSGGAIAPRIILGTSCIAGRLSSNGR